MNHSPKIMRQEAFDEARYLEYQTRECVVSAHRFVLYAGRADAVMTEEGQQILEIT